MSNTIITTENIVNVIETGAPQGPQGEPGLPGDEVIPTDVTINRDTEDNINTIVFASGKTITISRNIDGDIETIADGTYTRSIVRVDGEITEILIT
jgi:hypothetical protein